MTDNMEQKRLDVAKMDEVALDGVCHLMTAQDWDELLMNRISGSDNEPVKPLSADFIIRHKDEINMNLLALWIPLMIGMKVPGYDMNFVKRFWTFIQSDGGNDANLITAQKLLGDKYSIVEKEYLANLNPWDSAQPIYEDDAVKRAGMLPSFADIEAKPYFYDKAQVATCLQFAMDVPDTFIEKFIHMIHFPSLLENRNLGEERMNAIIDKFSVKIGRTRRRLFPDGTVIDTNDLINGITPGENYLDNLKRYATEDETAIKRILQKFPRAVLDCEDPANKEVMQGK